MLMSKEIDYLTPRNIISLLLYKSYIIFSYDFYNQIQIASDLYVRNFNNDSSIFYIIAVIFRDEI